VTDMDTQLQATRQLHTHTPHSKAATHPHTPQQGSYTPTHPTTITIPSPHIQ